MEAATAFTEALTYIEENTDHSDISSTTSTSSSLNRQIVTLINNRSAMYEKGNIPELAVEDCNKILDVYDRQHLKARQRKLRLLENHFKSYYDALVEVCSLQLLYMQQNREQLRMGLPASSPPPVPQSKLEELIGKLVPDQTEEYLKQQKAKLEGNQNQKPLPSNYTLLQLLKSFTNYNSWKSQAAKDGPANVLGNKANESGISDADKASLLMKQGRRLVYDNEYNEARSVILQAYSIVKNKPEIYNIMNDDDYPRLLEWTGMVKHWTYDLDGAESCYQECSNIEPINVSTCFRRSVCLCSVGGVVCLFGCVRLVCLLAGREDQWWTMFGLACAMSYLWNGWHNDRLYSKLTHASQILY